MSAPLIIFPTRRNLTKDLKSICREHEEVFEMRMAVVERAGDSIGRDAKAEPLRIAGCAR